ncbi:conserved hypothetical protein [Ricinus communis]|uniref:Uncharacterized protein n=1 Tax=Ricinus communis TaxID=3988 RepID=B9TP73_RICCO|nr:conserved hypothetical protein [Ricinus communis]
MLVEVRWRGAHHRCAHAQLARDEVRLQRVGDAQRQVDALLDQVDGAVAHLQVDRRARVAPQEFADGAQQLGLRQRLRTGDAQQAPRRVSLVAERYRHAVRHLQHAAAAGQRKLAGVGQAQAAGAAVQQAGAGPCLHLRQVARDHGARHAQGLGGAYHAAALGDADKHAGGGDTVHIRPVYAINKTRLSGFSRGLRNLRWRHSYCME